MVPGVFVAHNGSSSADGRFQVVWRRTLCLQVSELCRFSAKSPGVLINVNLAPQRFQKVPKVFGVTKWESSCLRL